MLDIPKDRKRLSSGRLCLLIAATALLFLSATIGWGQSVLLWGGLPAH